MGIKIVVVNNDFLLKGGFMLLEREMMREYCAKMEAQNKKTCVSCASKHSSRCSACIVGHFDKNKMAMAWHYLYASLARRRYNALKGYAAYVDSGSVLQKPLYQMPLSAISLEDLNDPLTMAERHNEYY